MSKRWGHAHLGRLRGLGRVWLWHGTLLGVRHHLRTSGVAFPFVIERLSNTPARPQEPSPCTPDLSRVKHAVSKRWGHAHSGRLRGLGRVWLWHGTLLGVCHHLRTSGVAFPFVLERLSNTPARPQEPSPCEACCEQAMGRPCGLGWIRLWHGTLLGVCHHLRTSGAAFPFVIERLSNTPARRRTVFIVFIARQGTQTDMHTIHFPPIATAPDSHITPDSLLSKARVAYYGQASALTEYVDSVGKPVPTGVSTAEHMLNLVNSDFTSHVEVDAVIDSWQKKAPPLPPPVLKSLPPLPERPSFFEALLLLFQKMANILFRSPSFARDKILVSVAMGVVYAGVVAFAHDREQDDVNGMYYGYYFVLGNVLFLNIATLAGYLVRWPAFQQELKAGMYGPATYWLVSGVLALIVDALAAAAGALPMLIAMGTPASSYFGIVVLAWCMFSFFAAVLEWVTLFGKEASMFISGLFGMHMTQTANIFVNYEQVIWPFRIFYYIFPEGYLFTSMLHLGFGDENAHFEGAYRLSTAPADIRNSTAAYDALLNGQLFVCPDQESCLGDNGRDVLAALGVRACPSAARSILTAACAHMVGMRMRM